MLTSNNATGIARLLVLDVKKPDYSLLKQQLEFAYNVANESPSAASFDGNLFAEQQQWNSRVFGKYQREFT